MKTLSAVYWSVLLLSLAPAAARADWTCRPGIKAPVRWRHGNVECASYNGRDCLWGECSGAGTSTAWTAPRPVEPLTCGADHKQKYGTDGYSQADHWCGSACAGMNECVVGFLCLPGIATPVRIMSGNVECASQNGRDCLWGACPKGGTAAIPWNGAGVVAPLRCGDDHARKFGSDGYSQADHWCRRACDALGCGIVGKVTQSAFALPTRLVPSGQENQGPPRTDKDADRYETPPTRLAGRWTAVDEAARAGAVKIHSCFPVYDAFNFLDDHGRVTVTLQESRWGAMPQPHMLMLGGGWRGGVLGLAGREEGTVVGPGDSVQRWTLRWDSAREHLVGERNGAPVRLARLIVSSPPPQQCGAGPP